MAGKMLRLILSHQWLELVNMKQHAAMWCSRDACGEVGKPVVVWVTFPHLLPTSLRDKSLLSSGSGETALGPVANLVRSNSARYPKNIG
jgi:hypothetical protein